ncbi:response regulator transcription factor [Steroidobacter sp. S1-65]|uniref:Response regulator transcription factor n=1 Tax=Steroidobacter gossypii TaxID=2805490 RepID=A0ABS1WUD0_9GAMM|nr:response regulator [Steroidobacter gossypii]MBM0104572.1 response regulator transcription factor [Steroidobacter gossypii]
MDTGGGFELEPRLDAAHGFAVHIVDDDDSFRLSLLRLFKANNLQAHGYGTLAEFEQAHLDGGPGCVLLDICMPDGDGLELFERRVNDEVLPVIFVSAFADIPISVRVMKSGALDILVKPVPSEKLLATIAHARQVAVQRFIARREARELLERYKTLTERERVVFAGVAEGKLNKQVAVEVGACERTIKSERAKMMKKLQLTRLVDVVRAAETVGLKLSFDDSSGSTTGRQQ